VISLEELTFDPDLAQPFDVLRSTGGFLNGTWQTRSEEMIPFYGVIAEPSVDKIEMEPQADVRHGDIVIWCHEPLYVTQGSTDSCEGSSSDIVRWRDHEYRLLEVRLLADWGYYRAVGVRMKAN
jgi:hypothetical protein